jgi:hypothetical protein
MAEFTLPARPAQLNKLIQANIRDFLEAFGLENLRRGRKLAEALCWLPARFASQMVDFTAMGGQDLALAHWMAIPRLEVVGGERPPRAFLGSNA